METVVSVNVGLPQDVEWQGNIVRTAIWKRPISGKIMARRLNLDGDGQGDLGGHGGENRAVMVYQIDSYRYWEKVLQRGELEYGQFGENLTVEGLPDSEVCIGDRYRIGDALFEVTQPRVTCYRVGLRMDEPNMPALLVSHRRPGFYFRVIEEGVLSVGDQIVKVADGPERVSVAEVDALLYLPGHPHDQLQRALRVPALSTGWKHSLQALVQASESGTKLGNAGLVSSPAPPPLWTGFRKLRVSEIHRESVDVLSFILESEGGSALPPPLPGQYLVVKLQPTPDSPSIARSYSISGPQDSGTYRISVKRAQGPGSNYLHDHIRRDELLEVSAPRGDFTLPGGTSAVVLLSAGIGVTPLLAMLHAFASSHAHTGREVWWCHGTRNGLEHCFAEEVRHLLENLQNGHSLVAFSRPDSGDVIGRDFDIEGHLSQTVLLQRNVPRSADFFLCGPPSFLSELTGSLSEWGVGKSQIHSEVFGAGPSLTPGILGAAIRSPHVPSGKPGKGPTVSFTRSGLSVPWNSGFRSLLEFAESCDVPVKWSCRAGVCHTCESGLIDGKVSYSPEPLDRPGDGIALICCSTPKSEIQLDL